MTQSDGRPQPGPYPHQPVPGGWPPRPAAPVLVPSRAELRAAFWLGVGAAVAVGLLSSVGLLAVVPQVRHSQIGARALTALGWSGLAVFWLAEIAALGFGVRGLLLAKQSAKRVREAVAAFAYLTTSVGFLVLPLVMLGGALGSRP